MKGYNKRKNEPAKFNSNNSLTFFDLLKKCFLFSFLFFFAFFIISAIVGLIFYNTKDPTPQISLAGIISLFLSILICSFILSKTLNEKNLLSGLILGIITLVMLLLISVFIPGSSNPDELSYFKYLLPIVSVIGSILGIKKGENKRKRRKHYK